MKKLMIVLVSIFATSTFAAPETKEFDSVGLTQVVIENTAGKVSVSASTGAKATVVATKNEFTDNCKMTLENVSNKLILTVKSSGFFSSGNCAVDLDVKVPKSVDLDLSVGAGNLKVSGIEGALVFKVGAGDIAADGTFKNIDGKTGSGNIDVKGMLGGGEIRSGSGAVNLTFLKNMPKGEIDIKTGNGDTNLLFPKGSLIKTSYQSGVGQLTNELGDNPNAKFQVSMKSGSADLTIKSY